MPRAKVFNPEGAGYDYATAQKHGLGPDKSGHWPSRVPETGVLLKGRKHKTWHKTVQGEEAANHRIIKRGKRYFSVPK